MRKPPVVLLLILPLMSLSFTITVPCLSSFIRSRIKWSGGDDCCTRTINPRRIRQRSVVHLYGQQQPPPTGTLFHSSIAESNTTIMTTETNLPSDKEESISNSRSSSTAGQGFGGRSSSKPKKKQRQHQQQPSTTAASRNLLHPETDKHGYALYQQNNGTTKSRIFDALQTYPCVFPIKLIIQSNKTDSTAFVSDMISLVAQQCNTTCTIQHSIRTLKSWTSVTIHAPVTSADQLYQLYKLMDQDERVKFKL